MYLRKTTNFLVALALITSISAAIFTQPVSANFPDQSERDQLLAKTNQLRQNQGLPPFKTNQKLSAAAQKKAQHLADNKYWSHISPDGKTPWDFINSEGYRFQKAGENLARGYSTAENTVSAWADSPAHYQNIVDPRFVDIGFGIALQDDKYVVVAMYAKP